MDNYTCGIPETVIVDVFCASLILTGILWVINGTYY